LSFLSFFFAMSDTPFLQIGNTTVTSVQTTRLYQGSGYTWGMKLTWTDAEDIGIELYDANPETDPLTVRFTDLHRLVVALPGFDDDPLASNEAKLEAIQMAWYEEFKDNQ
jgi:FeS assembly protein IscX